MSEEFDPDKFLAETEDLAPEASTFDPDAFLAETEPVEVSPESAETGTLEAGVLGFGEGASFGLTPVLGGIASAAGEAISDVGDVLGLTAEGQLEKEGFDVDDKKGLQGLLDAYYEGRERQSSAQEKAFEDSPYAYGAGLIGGSIAGGGAATAGAKALAGGGKLAQATSKALPAFTDAEKFRKAGVAGKMGLSAIEGAKAGAIAGFGTGEGRLLEGELEKTLEETAAGGVGGAAIGGALTGLGQAAGKGVSALKDSKLGSAYRYGQKGRAITEEQVNKDINVLAKRLSSRLQSKLKAAGAQKADILEASEMTARQVADGTPVTEAIDNTIEQVRQIRDINDTEVAQFKKAAIDYFDELKGNPKELKKLKESVDTVRRQKMLKDVQDEAQIKLQKASDKESIVTGRSAEEVDEFIEGSLDPNRQQLQYQVREEKYLPKELPEGKTVDDLTDDDLLRRLRVTDATEFQPTKVTSGIDETTGRPYAAYKDVGTGRMYGKVGKPLDMTFKNPDDYTARDLDDLIRRLNEKTKVAEGQASGELSKDPRIKNLTKVLTKDLRKLQENMLDMEASLKGEKLNLKDANQSYGNIMKSLKTLGIDPRKTKYTESELNMDQLIRKVENLITSSSSPNERLKRDFFKYAMRNDPSYAQKYENLMSELSNLSDLAKPIFGERGLSKTGIITTALGGVEQAAGKTANIAGRVSRAGKQAIQIPQETFRRLSPAAYETIAETFEAVGRSDFGNLVRSMKGESEQRRTALLYALYQQPQFREMIQSMGEGLLNTFTPVDTEE